MDSGRIIELIDVFSEKALGAIATTWYLLRPPLTYSGTLMQGSKLSHPHTEISPFIQPSVENERPESENFRGISSDEPADKVVEYLRSYIRE
jgi:hypothetical protein